MAEELGQSQRYIVTRPSELSLLPQFTPGVSSSYVDRWRLEVDPLSFSKDRMQFSWRSPGISTIMSSNLFLEFSVDIQCQGAEWDYVGSKCGQVQNGYVGGNTAAYPQAAIAQPDFADASHKAVQTQNRFC